MNTNQYEREFETLINNIRKLPYGKRLFELSGISEELLDMARYTNRFFSNNTAVADLSVDPNANIKQRSAITYINEAPKPQFRMNNYYQLWSRLRDSKGLDRANQAVEADINGEVYIADFHLWNLPYCYAFSAMDILNNGMPFIPNPKTAPAVHFDSFIQHIIQATMYYSNSIAGAVAFPDFFPALWFVYQNDKKLGYPTSDPVKFEKWIEQQFQLFTFTINQPYRSGTQSPFVNISVFDKGFLKDMFEGLTWVNPRTNEIVEIDLNGVDYLQKKYSEWFCRASKEQLFTFPVMTANMVTEKSNDGLRRVTDFDFFKWAAKVTIDRALFNIYAGNKGQLSSCCRLRNDTTNQFFNSLGSGGLKIGSHRVVTINLPRLAKQSKNLDDFKSKLKDKMELCHDILRVHRDTLKSEIAQGLLPLYTLGFMDLNTQFSTVGIIGFYEAMLILGYDLVDENSLVKADEVVKLMNEINDNQGKIDKCMYNLEQIPGESAAVKLAEKDKLVLGSNEFEIYSNQFIPLVKHVPMALRFRVQGALDAMMSGGSILHVNLAEKVQSVDMLMTLMDYAIQQGVVYFAPNYNIQECEQGHINVGKNDLCPECGEKIKHNYTRVVGFYTPKENWKEERRGSMDYESRIWY